jgi:hypothetical protein
MDPHPTLDHRCPSVVRHTGIPEHWASGSAARKPAVGVGHVTAVARTRGCGTGVHVSPLSVVRSSRLVVGPTQVASASGTLRGVRVTEVVPAGQGRSR